MGADRGLIALWADVDVPRDKTRGITINPSAPLAFDGHAAQETDFPI
jgi:hypothetical protein